MSKRKDILEAVISLSDSCKTPGKMTISAIAEYAGVGKGTVYDYFSSKEEIISEAIQYFIDTRLDPLFNISFSGNFREGFERISELTRRIYRKNHAFFQMVFLTGQQTEFSASFSTPKASKQRNEMIQKITRMLFRLVEIGKAEGIITGKPNEKDLIFTFLCITSAICCTYSQVVSSKVSIVEETNFFYEKFVKLLN